MSEFEEFHDEILRRLSRPRLDPYLRACGDNLAAAVRLYLWNIRVGSAYFESLHLLEIGVRNAIHDVLTCRNGLHTNPATPWYRDDMLRLQPPTRQRIKQAIEQATRDGVPEIPGKVVAELTLGFWTALLAVSYNRSLWQPYLRHAFREGTRRQQLHHDLVELTRLRNRIAHHEPCHHRDLTADYRRIRRVAGHLSTRFEAFIVRTSQIDDVLSRRPDR